MSGITKPKVFLCKDKDGNGAVPAAFEKVRYTILWTNKLTVDQIEQLEHNVNNKLLQIIDRSYQFDQHWILAVIDHCKSLKR